MHARTHTYIHIHTYEHTPIRADPHSGVSMTEEGEGKVEIQHLVRLC